MATPTYNSWNAMRSRCLCKTNPEYHRYGGAGITIDPTWNSYAAFRSDMGRRPEGTSLDRIDGSKGYYKENCRWATPKEQHNNKKLFSTNTSGVKGVCWKNNRWFASGWFNGKQISLYSGNSFEKAVMARKVWEEAQ